MFKYKERVNVCHLFRKKQKFREINVLNLTWPNQITLMRILSTDLMDRLSVVWVVRLELMQTMMLILIFIEIFISMRMKEFVMFVITKLMIVRFIQAIKMSVRLVCQISWWKEQMQVIRFMSVIQLSRQLMSYLSTKDI